jgi:two-component system OmpR family sensor kinase
MLQLHSLRARLTFWYTAMLAVVLIAFSAISYALLARATRAATDATLTEAAHDLAVAMEDDPRRALAVGALPFGRENERQVVLFTPRGEAVASSPRTLTVVEERRLEALVRRGARGLATIAGGPEGDGIRVCAVDITSHGERRVLAVAVSLDEQADRLESAAQAVLFGIPLALLLAAGGGYLLARKALAPVAAMSRKARQIGAETLAERIDIGDERDELGLLAVTLNELLERLQRAFDSQRRFMAEASHELRTPVAVVRGEADVTLSRAGRSEEEYRESMQIVQKASLRLSRIVENLFLLARTDAGSYPMRRTRFYLDELIADCLRSLRNIATARGVTLDRDCGAGLLIVADEELLHRLLLNLLENALKFTPAGGAVRVTATTDGEAYVVDVRDSGGGIAAGERERIFERFYRAASRGADPENGAGLGLPIARWIAEAHGGTLLLAHSDASGSTFRVTLPHG